MKRMMILKRLLQILLTLAILFAFVEGVVMRWQG